MERGVKFRCKLDLFEKVQYSDESDCTGYKHHGVALFVHVTGWLIYWFDTSFAYYPLCYTTHEEALGVLENALFFG